MNQQHTYAVVPNTPDLVLTRPAAEEYGRRPTRLLPEHCTKMVYLINHNPLLAKDAALQLSACGYRVVTLDSMASLAEHLPAVPVNPVLIDAGCRGLDERMLGEIGKIRGLCQNKPPMVLLSSHAHMELRLKAAHAGIDAFFIKPLDIQALADYLDALSPHQEQVPYRLLLIGNDRQRSAAYADAFHAAGMEVTLILKPLDMFSALGDSRPERVVMDVETPGCGGVDLTALISAKQDIPGSPHRPAEFAGNAAGMAGCDSLRRRRSLSALDGARRTDSGGIGPHRTLPGPAHPHHARRPDRAV